MVTKKELLRKETQVQIVETNEKVFLFQDERDLENFQSAARNGNVELLQQFIKKFSKSGKRKKINKLNKQGLSALHQAVRYGHMEVIKLLVDNRANVNIVGADGAQPIHYAAKYFPTDKHVADTTPTQEEKQGAQEALSKKNGDISDDTETVGKNNALTYLLDNGARIDAKDNYAQTPLNYAAVLGNVAAMTVLLNRRPGINIIEEIDWSGGTALHNACSNGETKAAKLLLSFGAKLMVKDKNKRNPLHYAAVGEGLKTLREIINDIETKKIKIDRTLPDIINDQDNEQQSILHLAVDNGDKETSRLLIKNGANVNLADKTGTTPLHLAAATGNVEIVEDLIELGACIEAKNVTWDTPLHKAAKLNRTEVVKFLLDKGSMVDALNKDNKTPLIAASAHENLKTIEILLEYNSDLMLCDKDDKSAIFWAAERDSITTLELLVKHGQKNLPNFHDLINQHDRFKNRPLHIASKKGYKRVVELLLSNQAEVDPRNDEGLTPLHVATMHGRKGVVLVLLEQKTSMFNDEDESGNTALHLAALHGKTEIIEILINHGASVDPRNSKLWTPLDCAAVNGHVAAVRILLKRDASVDPVDLASTTPLHLASKSGHSEVVGVLLKNGADITLGDHSGITAFDMAVENSHRDVALLFLEHPDWLSVLKKRTGEGVSLTTPMRQLIKKLPDIAYNVLNKCMKLTTDLPLDSDKYKVTFYYDLLDDTYAKWNDENEENDQKNDNNTLVSDDDGKPKRLENAMEDKDLHPLALMCEYRRDKLLNHPLVLSLIYDKWQKFGRLTFYLKFSLYFLFLFFLTGYVLVSRPLLPSHKTVGNITQCIANARESDKKDSLVIMFVILGRYVILVLSSVQLLLEICQLVARRMKYMADVTNFVEWLTFILAIFYTHPHIDEFITAKECSDFVISVGSICIFLAWIDLLLFLQKFPTLGIYVVMFTDVFKTFLKFSLTFVLFVVAFGLGFYTLLADASHTENGEKGTSQDVGVKNQLIYMNIGRAVLKTTVMMIGEFNFDEQFNTPGSEPPLITWFLFFLFVIIMTILLMNLMVGLAVDDIKGVLDQAVLTRVAMQVHLVLDVEKSLPSSFRRRYIMKEKTVLPNRDFGWSKLMSHITTMGDIQEAIDPTKSVSDVVHEHTHAIRESVDKLKNNFKEMTKQMKNVEQMLDKKT